MECNEKNIPLTAYFSVVKQQHYIFLNKRLENEEISAGQAGILVYLLFNEKACQEDIANSYKVDKGTVARGIRKLEDLNLIFKEIDENNRRRYKLSLNQRGKELAKKIIEIDAEWEELIYSDINIPKDVLTNILKEISAKTIKINKQNDKNGVI